MMKREKDLIKSCLQKDRVAQKELYLKLLPYLRAISNRYLRDNSYVKDALQESFIKIFSKLQTYDENKAELKYWAARITINTCININIRMISKSNVPLNEEMHDAIMVPMALKDISDQNMLYILRQLPRTYFEVFNLYVIDGYSHIEIAGILNITPASSRQKLSRARAWIKKTFKDNPDYLNNITDPFYLIK